ncbi:MAG: hypothetical protein COV76_02255 [Candidatus Omnitrophica bacterium CG11_big_fil_rev_8_21_14_0_20_64_10]|nr:MAG: hypothetical protein COV76_02255 [Candidatus Omnitrophica bacterium CG11_big_fil_rev_8_21_14_0_20_64_10]
MLRQISLFADLMDTELDFIAERARLVELDRDSILYRQGDPPDALYCLLSGRVKVLTGVPGGPRAETAEVLHRGEYFGMISLLTGDSHSLTAVTLNDSILLKVSREDFEAILKEIPRIAVHLSTTLSRRLQRRSEGSKKEVFESTLISIYGPVPGTGQTTYAVNLAASLAKETGKRVILVDMSPSGDVVCKALGMNRCPIPIRLTEGTFSPAHVSSAIADHPGVAMDTLSVAHDPRGEENVSHVTQLLSYLANLYHFVITDLPHGMNRTVFRAMVQADQIHLVCDQEPASLQAVAGLVTELRGSVQQAEERLRVVVNRVPENEHIDSFSRAVGRQVDLLLPPITEAPAPGHPIVLAHPDWAYAQAVRRTARQVGRVLVGLVLGSGAAMGLAHIGVLQVLEREKIPIDIIAGSSMGALIGALWASGRDTAGLKRVAAEFRTKRSLLKLVDLTIPKFGIFTGRRVAKYLHRHLGDVTFQDLKIPLKVTAVDYRRREVLCLEEGPVVPAVRASVSIPGVFEPIKMGHRWLIDGGILDPVPTDLLIRAGVHKIIAVNTLPSPEKMQRRQSELARETAQVHKAAKAAGGFPAWWFNLRRLWWAWRDPNILDVLVHTMQAMEYELAEVGCAQADVALRPTMGKVNWWEFHNVDILVQQGIEEAERQLPAIKRLIAE